MRAGGSIAASHTRVTFPLADRSENVDDRDDDDDDEIRETADARDGTDGQTVDELPEMNDASQNEPKRRYGSKEPKAATSKRRQKDSVEKQDTGAKKAKSKAAPAKNCGQRSSCRTVDSCVNLNKSYLSMYHKLFFLCEKHFHSEHVFI